MEDAEHVKKMEEAGLGLRIMIGRNTRSTTASGRISNR
jgi:hypothetical protein